MLVSKTIEVDMGHRVTNHKSKCRNIHGHRYTVEVGVNDRVIDVKGASDEGMVIDFSDLKNVMMDKIDGLMDHGFMCYEQDPLVEFFKQRQEEGMKVVIAPFVPTAENIAKYLFGIMDKALYEKGIALEYVKIFETPTSMAIYTRRDASI